MAASWARAAARVQGAQREVLEDPADAVRVDPHQPPEGLGPLGAGRALEVPEFHDRHRRALGPERGRAPRLDDRGRVGWRPGLAGCRVRRRGEEGSQHQAQGGDVVFAHAASSPGVSARSSPPRRPRSPAARSSTTERLIRTPHRGAAAPGALPGVEGGESAAPVGAVAGGEPAAPAGAAAGRRMIPSTSDAEPARRPGARCVGRRSRSTSGSRPRAGGGPRPCRGSPAGGAAACRARP